MRSALSGDRDAAALYLGYARARLRDLKSYMQLGGLQQLQRTFNLSDGTTIYVACVFGQEYVSIDSPAQTVPRQETVETVYDAEVILDVIALKFDDVAYTRGSGAVTLTQPQSALAVPAEVITIRSRVNPDVFSGNHQLYYTSSLIPEFPLTRPSPSFFSKQYASGSVTIFRQTLIYPMANAALFSMAVGADSAYATFESRTVVAAGTSYVGYEQLCYVNFEWSGFHSRDAAGRKTANYPRAVTYGVGPAASGAYPSQVASYDALQSAWASISWRPTITLPAEPSISQPDKTVTFNFTG